jgi:hypothetical protein
LNNPSAITISSRIRMDCSRQRELQEYNHTLHYWDANRLALGERKSLPQR